MEVKLMFPLNQIVNEKIIIHVEDTMTAMELMKQLYSMYPEFPSFFGDTDIEEAFNRRFLVLREGFLLKQQDEIKNTDKISIFQPVAGG